MKAQTKRNGSWTKQLSEMSLTQLDELIENATRQRSLAARETELQRLRKEIIGRIVSSGYSFEEIFSGTGRFPEPLIRRLSGRDERSWPDF